MASISNDAIVNIQVNLGQGLDAINRYKDSLESCRKGLENLAKQKEAGIINDRQYAKSAEALKLYMDDYKKSIKEVEKEIKNEIKVNKENEGSLKAMRAELSVLTSRYDNMSKSEREAANQTGGLKDQINALTTQIKQAEEGTQRFYRNVGNYQGSIMSALGINNQFAQSLVNLGQGGGSMVQNLTSSFSAFGKTLMGLMANPAFLAIAGIGGAVAAFKFWFDYNKSLEEATDLTQQFLGLTGEGLNNMVAEIQATADTYGKDYKETLEAVDAVTAQFGIDSKDALDVLNKGFQSGADLNGDMLDKVKEMSPAFKAAGLSADEMVAVIQQTRSGLFSDEGLDTISKAGVRLRNMSDETAQALDAIGISSDEMKNKLADGSLTMFDAIQQVSDRLTELPPNAQEAGAVMQDVFGRQGAQSGEQMAAAISSLNTDLEGLTSTTGDYGKALEEQRQTSVELNKSMATLFGVSNGGFRKMQVQLKTGVQKALIGIIKGCIGIVNYFIEMYNKSMVFRASIQAVVMNFKGMWNAAKFLFNMIVDQVKAAGRSLAALGDIVEGVFTLSYDKIKQGLAGLANGYKATFNEISGDTKAFFVDQVKMATDATNEIRNGGGLSLLDASKYDDNSAIVDGGSEPTSTQTPASSKPSGGSSAKKAASAARAKAKAQGKSKKEQNRAAKEAEKQAKEAEARAKKEAEKQAKRDKAELDAQKQLESSMLAIMEQGREKQVASVELKYNQQIAALKKKIEDDDKLAKDEQTLTEKAREDINKTITNLEKAKEIEIIKVNREYRKKKIDEEVKYWQNVIKGYEEHSEEYINAQTAILIKQREAELEQDKLTEDEKEAIILEYDKKIREIQTQQDEWLMEQMKTEFANKIATMKLQGETELDILREEQRQREEMIGAAQQKEGETDAEFKARMLQQQQEYVDAKKEIADKENDIQQAKYELASEVFSGLSSIMDKFSDENKAMAKMSKVLALGEIAVNTGKALAAGIAEAQSVPFPANIGAIATTISTILSGVASAISSVKSAKFAKGGDVRGAGSATSDSISARLSNGESVINAKSTSMFAPLLSAINQAGGGVPIYGQGVGVASQTQDTMSNQLAKALSTMPNPVVSVEEINKVNTRVTAIENLATL